jgi:hypothetical protein
MPCILLILVLAFPRIVLAVLYFLSNYLGRAYHSFLIVLLGFIFLPLTTLVYAWIVNSGMAVAGINLVWIILAVVIDLGGFGGGYRHGRR